MSKKQFNECRMRAYKMEINEIQDRGSNEKEEKEIKKQQQQQHLLSVLALLMFPPAKVVDDVPIVPWLLPLPPTACFAP